MKILIIGQLKGFESQISGGPERVFKNQIIGFSKYGTKHTIIATLLGFKEFEIPSFSRKILLYPVSYDVTNKPIFSADTIHARRVIKNITEFEDPDFILLHDPSYIVLLPNNISSIATFLHGPFWLQSGNIYPRVADITKLLYRRLVFEEVSRSGLMKSQYIICITEYLRKILPENIRSKALVLENPVDDRFFLIKRETSKNKEVVSILSVGRLSPVKGYETLVLAIKNLLKSNDSFKNKIQVRIVAAYQKSFDWYYRRILQLIKNYNLDNIINIITNVPSDEALIREYTNADVYVHTSFSEGLPNAIQEAMASGLPIIASNVGAIPSIIKNGYNGLIFNVGDANALSQYIIKLATEPIYRLKIGESARATAYRRWSLSSYIVRFDLITNYLQ